MASQSIKIPEVRTGSYVAFQALTDSTKGFHSLAADHGPRYASWVESFERHAEALQSMSAGVNADLIMMADKQRAAAKVAAEAGLEFRRAVYSLIASLAVDENGEDLAVFDLSPRGRFTLEFSPVLPMPSILAPGWDSDSGPFIDRDTFFRSF